MKLNWIYDVENRMARATIDSDLYYECGDGGQTIRKYKNGVLEQTFHKYGPNHKFTDIAFDGGIHIDQKEIGWEDSWPDELKWLSKNYSNVVGSFFDPEYDDGFKTKEGEIIDIGQTRGMGITGPEEKISINRLACPANEVEWWDWETIAKGPDVAEDCMGRGTWWRKHKVTGEIVRTSGGTPPYPCCVHPVVHGPYKVDESDIDLKGGQRLN